ncbi:class I SAM-dependent methyltransferase [Alloacidobacterium dinghuense]|uniref:Class I SAM-dependent methyltransferase n=1 Tax=Alloacidobacterium dinghuense TaxID=2763107 RepID=A0A7G8BDT8_9BACT|nr:class I SAM-dependent methyltransferase [Alloacidobacterium dinghuense]QNI30708.1 class I SAM-dependent methyltransferase [Alloacidobacterium dinghuense]
MVYPAMLSAIAMRRQKWFEFHDHRLYPGFLRDLVTDALEAIWNYTNSYRVIVPRLRAAMEDAGTHQIVDLCSGGGGPWIHLQEQFESAENYPINVALTDKYPNEKALAQSGLSLGLEFYSAPVDAREIPVGLNGFRTIFSTFHHFNPVAARAILADAVERRQGIAIFEAAKRSFRTMLATSMVPLLSWRVTPGIRPFRWSRILWTYLLPVVPFTLFVDGVLSSLRAYSLEDLRELTEGLGGGEYQWEIGEQGGGRIGITYLIGKPLRSIAPDEHLVSAALADR